MNDHGQIVGFGVNASNKQHAFLLSISANAHPTLDPISDLTVIEGAPSQSVALSGISPGAGNEIQVVRVTAMSSNPVLIPDPTVRYATPAATGTLSFQPVANLSGRAAITVTVQDDGGAANGGKDNVSRQFTVTVTPVNDPPSITLTAPIDGQVFGTPTNIVLRASAGDPDGRIVRIEFFDGSTKLGESAASPGSLVWTNPVAGSHALTARATDDEGLVAVSQIVRIEVIPRCAAVCDGLISWWKAEGSASDSVERNSGQWLGSERYVAGKVGKAFEVGESIVKASSLRTLSFAPGSSATFECWAYATANNLPFHILGKRTGCSSWNYQLGVDWAWPAIPINSWMHWAMVVESSRTLVYTNGVLCIGWPQGFGPENDADFVIGSSGDCPRFQGYIDELAVYNRGLSESEIGSIVAAGSAGKCPCEVPTPLVISLIADQAIREDTSTPRIPLAVTNLAAGATIVRIIAHSSDSTLVRSTSIEIFGTGTERSVLITPEPNAFGTATISLVAEQSGGLRATNHFELTVAAVNDAPSLDQIADRTVLEDAARQTVPLSGISSGAANEVQVLKVTAVSNNPALIPDPLVTYSSPAVMGTLSFQPVANLSGTATITVTFQDDGGAVNGGKDSVSRQFMVTVTPVNDAPTLDAIADRTVLEDAGVQTVALGGISAGAANESQAIRVTAVSSNPELTGNPTVAYTSPGATGTLSFQPMANASGTATITVTVQDDGGTANGGQDTTTRQFKVTVTPVNDAPTLDAIADRTVLEDAGVQTVALGGISSGAANETQVLKVMAMSSNPGLTGSPTVAYTSPGTTGTLSFQPMANASGTATITVTVQDDGGTANGGQDATTRQFKVTVTPVNDAPTISTIADQTTAEDTPTGELRFSVRDAESPAEKLVVSGTSSDSALLPSTGILIAGVAGERTLKLLPASGKHGAVVVTLRVQDEAGAMASTALRLTVTPRSSAQPPSVQLIVPKDYASFAPDPFQTPPSTNIDVMAKAEVGGAPIAKVEFFSGSTLIGVSTTPPYQMRWANVGVGDYRLVARATDAAGLMTESAAVRISVSDLSAEVAIVRNYPDEEIAQLRDYLLEMGMGSRVFEQEGLNFELLHAYRLIFWSGLSRTGEGITDNDVDTLNRAFSAGIPLYFIGDHLVGDVQKLSPGMRAIWENLLHLGASAAGTVGGRVDVLPFDDNPDGTASLPAIVNGRFGTVADFTQATPVDMARLVGAEPAEEIGRMGKSTALLAFEKTDFTGALKTRSFTQLGRIWTGAESPSAEVTKLLFQNVVCWLRECRYCSALDLRIDAEAEKEVVNVGEVARYVLRVRQSGECEATGVTLVVKVPEGASAALGRSERGVVTVGNGKVLFRLGHLTSAEAATVELEWVPIKRGPMEMCVDVRGNNEIPDPGNHACVTVMVEGDEVPRLEATREGTSVVLSWNAPSAPWLLESSPGLGIEQRWTPVFGVPGFTGGRVRQVTPLDSSARFFRLKR